MGFDGVIVTDAMDMKAISENIGVAEANKMAVEAGADMICMPVILRSKSDISKLDAVFELLTGAVKNKEISENQINESVTRIFKLKNLI